MSVVQDILEHHGVKGMKWGIRRKATVNPQEIIVRDSRKKLKTSGGKSFPAHADAVRARTLGQKGKASGLKSLSDQELQTYAHRLQLEQNVQRLNYNDKPAAERFVRGLLGQSGKNSLQSATTDAATQRVRKNFVKAGLLAAA